MTGGRFGLRVVRPTMTCPAPRMRMSAALASDAVRKGWLRVCFHGGTLPSGLSSRGGLIPLTAGVRGAGFLASSPRAPGR